VPDAPEFVPSLGSNWVAGWLAHLPPM